MIKFLCILDQSNNVALARNYSRFEQTHIESVINSHIDLIELTYAIGNNSGQLGIIGHLAQDPVYGFVTITQNKIIAIVDKTEKRVKEIIRSIYEIYKADILNPFKELLVGKEGNILADKIDAYLNTLREDAN